MTSNSGAVERDATKTIDQWQPLVSAWNRGADAAKRIGEGDTETATALILKQQDRFKEREMAMLSRAIDLNGRAGRLYLENPGLNGEAWYDQLARIARIRIEVSEKGATTTMVCPRDAAATSADRWQGAATKVDAIRVVVSIDTPAGREEIELPSDFGVRDPWSTDPDDSGIVITRSSSHEVEELAKLIRYAIFNPDSDEDSDSYDTQEAEFRRAAHKVACELLLGTKAGERSVAYAAEHLLWHTLPENMITEIETGKIGEPVTVRFRPREQETGAA